MKHVHGPPITIVESHATPLPPLYCLKCGYDLRGLPSPRCSECGAVFSYDRWLSVVRAIQDSVPVAGPVVRRANGSWRVLAAGVLLRILLMAVPRPSVFSMVMLGLTGLCIVVAFGLALSALRFFRLPPWAVGQLSAPPNRPVIIGTLVSSVVLLVSAFV